MANCRYCLRPVSLAGLNAAGITCGTLQMKEALPRLEKIEEFAPPIHN